MAVKQTRATGAANRRAADLVSVALDVSPVEREQIRVAAAVLGYRSMRSWVRSIVVAAARKVVDKRP